MSYFGRWFKWVAIIAIVLLIAAGWVLYPLLRGATGYSAKMLCSGIFVEGQTQEQVERRELSKFPFNYIHNEVDYDDRVVNSTVLGVVSQFAVNTDETGSTLFPKGFSSIEGKVPAPKPLLTNLAWPMGELIADTFPADIEVHKLRAYINKQFTSISRAVVVVKDGQLIAEQYAEGIDEYTPLLGWSMTKTLTAAIVGRLVEEGRLQINQSGLVAAWSSDERQSITLTNLLQMSSGLQWNEDYSTTSLTDVSRMLYIENDMVDYACSAPVAAKPNAIWSYSSGTTNIISGIIRSCFDTYQEYYQYPQQALFAPIGMQHSLIETDAQGNFVASSYGYCSARDWARLGMLYLNNGNWQGNQLLPTWWVAYSTTPAKQSSGQYGAHVWLNASRQLMPDLPADVYFFNGYRGQRVTVIPSHNMVVVCLNSSSEKIDFNTYLNGMMAFVNEQP
ncbi:serine hydrolase [Carboxylicivirga taeanensis]|uniref:serine hydrolase domain-containing protein n=1 Tax=Carboxylicivirga taeanensis TaxID=1416875 RepID=UPI003F6DF15D